MGGISGVCDCRCILYDLGLLLLWGGGILGGGMGKRGVFGNMGMRCGGFGVWGYGLWNGLCRGILMVRRYI